MKNFLEEIDSDYKTQFAFLTATFNAVMFLTTMGNIFLYLPASIKLKYVMGVVILIEIAFCCGWVAFSFSHEEEPECNFPEIKPMAQHEIVVVDERDDGPVADDLNKCIHSLRDKYILFVNGVMMATAAQTTALARFFFL
ncbi:hypothetical protein RF11_00771 [Thelohanellus kitauei]|uniref:Uncharacterized protein n=1 Tax=Thelohanellus kitauei TaxID=669202 RepID=A0A0C2MVF6_THEKT|nr:hypothetical protein RF11_00771 [Thelohanellus kitauei]